MKIDATTLVLIVAASVNPSRAAYNLVREYSGKSFFDRWDYYGKYDNLTLGDVNYLDQPTATSQRLAYVNDLGNAIIKVDNQTNVANGQKRNSIRLTSKDAYPIGSLWIIDTVHIPYGCSVWPAFWSKGALWPDQGEIDIIEGINKMGSNQMAIHTTKGCTHSANSNQQGKNGQTDCSQGSGCPVVEPQPNSFGESFAKAGGGVFAAQFEASGIYMWFWSRPNIPANVKSGASNIDISKWGKPSAAYPSSGCDINKYFGPQNLVLDITLCGVWAGVPDAYAATCQSHKQGACYTDNVVGPGTNFNNAYFEIPFIRAYANVNSPAGTAATQTTAKPSSSSTTVVVITQYVPTITLGGPNGTGGTTISAAPLGSHSNSTTLRSAGRPETVVAFGFTIFGVVLSGVAMLGTWGLVL